DQIRPGTAETIARIQRLGLRTVLLTGDTELTARSGARQAGIAEADRGGGTRPDGKGEFIRRLQESGQPAAFVGDGVNDAAALAQADLGMALATGSDAAIGAADLTLARGGLGAV